MKNILLLVLAVSFASSFNTQAKADTNPTMAAELGAIQASLDARDEFVTALQKKDFTVVAQHAFEIAIKELVKDLRERNDVGMANELMGQWEQTQSMFFSLSMDELGDHAPLFTWLEGFFTKMSDKYGAIIFNLPYVKDLRTLNFALPVVFNPKGKWQSAEYDNRIEYRKHFIPFANIVTFYSASYACNYYATKAGQPQLKKLCKTVAEKLQFVMGRYIAAPISDWIFRASNHSIQIGKDRLRYTTASELRAAVIGN